MSPTSFPHSSKPQLKILLVDDVDLFMGLEKSFFRREQFCLLTAVNGDEALRLARDEKPALVFLDLSLAGINGDEVCRRLKADPETAQVPVVMVLKPGSESELAACRAAGCDDLIFKPLQQENFLRVSCRLLSLTERVTPRSNARILVNYGLRKEKLLQQYTVNIGAKGLFLATEAHLSLDTCLTLQIQLPDGQPLLCCHGRIAWLNHPDWVRKTELPFGMGIEFLDLTAEQHQRLTRYLTSSQFMDNPTGC